MRKRFILLIDFSESSVNLLKYAADWATRTEVEIMLVHQTVVVAPALTDIESKRRIAEHANAEARRELRALAQAHLPHEVKVSHTVSEEPLRTTLSRLLVQPFQDLVLVGMKGTGLLKQLLLGSVAMEVITNTGNCIVAVPQDVKAFSQSTIHVSVTEKYPLNIPELNNYLQFLGEPDLKITFFYLAGPNEGTDDIEKRLREYSDLFAPRFATDFAIFIGAAPFQDIKRIVTNRADEVLVVQRGSRLLTDQLFRRFLINELVYEGHIPLVVLP